MKNFTPEHTIRYNTPISKPINGVRVIMPRDNYAEWDKQEGSLGIQGVDSIYGVMKKRTDSHLGQATGGGTNYQIV